MASGLERLARSGPFRAVARLGLLARAAFYLVLAGLAVSLLAGARGPGSEANANGALRQVAGTPVGLLLLVAAAVGFAGFGLARLAGAASDGGPGRWRRLSTAGQGLLYLGMATVTATFVLGNRGTGSEEQQRTTARSVLELPGGRLLLAAVGAVVLAMCTWQLVVAARGHFADTLADERMSPRSRRWAMLTARIGIPARALAVVPVGVFLIVAAAQADPAQARGLDAMLLELAVSAWGRVLVLLTAVGFTVFAAYSVLEARFREVSAGA